MRYLPLFVLLFQSFTCFSQIAAPRTGSIKSTTTNLDLKTVKGSPYEKDNFSSGKLVDDITKKEKICLYRYNAYDDIIEIKNNSINGITAVLKDKNIYIKSNNIEYRFNHYQSINGETISRISLKLLDGELYNLHKFIRKKFSQGKKAETTLEKDVPSRFKTNEEYFLEKDGMLTFIELRRKKIVKNTSLTSKRSRKIY